MSGTSKAILSMCVLLLAALVIYYGMTPVETAAVQPKQQKQKQVKPMFRNQPVKLRVQTELGIPQAAIKLATVEPIPVSTSISETTATTPEITAASATHVDQIPRPTPVVHEQVVPRIQVIRRYEVQTGETLGEIASRELGSFKRWQEIATLNGIDDPSQIMPGLILQLPQKEFVDIPVPTPVQPTPSAQQQVMVHAVVDGDTLSSIAEQYYGDPNLYDIIAKANPSINPNRLSIGMKLKIPKK